MVAGGGHGGGGREVAFLSPCSSASVALFSVVGGSPLVCGGYKPTRSCSTVGYGTAVSAMQNYDLHCCGRNIYMVAE